MGEVEGVGEGGDVGINDGGGGRIIEPEGVGVGGDVGVGDGGGRVGEVEGVGEGSDIYPVNVHIACPVHNNCP